MVFIQACNLQNTLDLTPLSAMGVQFRCSDNSDLKNVINPASSELMTSWQGSDCDLGYIDFTVFSGVNDDINIQLGGNGMTAAEVNEILVDLDGEGWIDGTVNLAGSNAAPDGTSGGFDGLTAKTNLQGNGWTVTTN